MSVVPFRGFLNGPTVKSLETTTLPQSPSASFPSITGESPTFVKKTVLRPGPACFWNSERSTSSASPLETPRHTGRHRIASFANFFMTSPQQSVELRP